MADLALELVRGLDEVVAGRTIASASVTTHGELVLFLVAAGQITTRGPYDAELVRVSADYCRVVSLDSLQVRFPLVQWLDDEEVIVVDTRCVEGQKNAHVFDTDGRPLRSFRVGDAVEELRATRARDVWVSYFDEGFQKEIGCESSAPGVSTRCSGLARFDRDGRLEWMYPNSPYLLECYALNVDEASTWLLTYPGWEMVEVAGGQTSVVLSNVVPGARALAVGRRTALLCGSYEDPGSLWECPRDDLSARELEVDVPEGARVFGMGATLHVVTAKEWLTCVAT